MLREGLFYYTLGRRRKGRGSDPPCFFLQNPPLHLVQFTSEGQIVSAGVESNVVKVWPRLTQESSIYVKPLHSITVHEHCCVYRYGFSLGG